MIEILKLIMLLLLPFIVQASTNPLSVVINEVAWMGTESNSSDEWIELYNNTKQSINLEGWGLYEKETLIEPLTGIIEADSYYLIERTDDSTIQNITASQEPSSWGGYGLNNNGEDLKLVDKDSAIIDEVNCSEKWFAGESSPLPKTMERINSQEDGSNPNNWQTSFSTRKIALDSQGKTINGTPNAKNSINLEPLIKNNTYSPNIIINEILPSPKGSDSENEWIELRNKGNQEVSLFNWSIRDKKGTINTYTFPENTIIKPQGFLVLTRPITKITLNNSEDGLDLIQPDQNVISSLDYNNAPLGESYNYINSEWVWSDQPSPDNINLPKKEVKEETPQTKNYKNNNQETKNYKNNNQEKNTQKEIININSIEKPTKTKMIDKESFVNVFLTAFLISILFSFFILKLKKRIEEKFDFQ